MEHLHEIEINALFCSPEHTLLSGVVINKPCTVCI
jgi:hypothetical protein